MIPKLLYFGFVVFISLIPLLLFFIDEPDLAISFSSIGFFGVAILILYSSWLDRKNLRMLIGNSIKWFQGTIVFGFLYLINGVLNALEGYSLGLYHSQDPLIIMRYYFFSIAISLLIVILIIHIEQSISYLSKFRLSDIYSHDLGNIMQIILNNLEGIDSDIDVDNQQTLDLIRVKCIEAGELIKEIREV